MNERILVVEDDPHIQSLVASVLQGEGYRVLVASNAGTAREFMRRPGLVQLVLADFRLGGQGEPGSELGPFGRDGAPVVLMSADAHAGVIAERLGAAAFLPKPFDIEHLTAVVARHARTSDLSS